MKKLLVLPLALMSSLALADMNVDMKVVVDGKEAEVQCQYNAATQEWNLPCGDLSFAAMLKSHNETHADVDLKALRKNDKGDFVVVGQGQLQLEIGKSCDLPCKGKETPDSEEKEICKLRIIVTK